MTILQGAVLGLIQGIGEFLPISSSGHLLLAQKLMDIDANGAAMKMLSILLHVGTLIPVLIVFWKDWIDMILHPVRNKTLLLLIVASLPTLAIYLLAKKLIVINGPDGVLEGFEIFDSGWFLGASFLVTALFLLICDRLSIRQQKMPSSKPVRYIPAIVMGCFQGIGMIPGVSRSGSTILGGVSSGLNKTRAARFSFLMSAPAILASLLMEGRDAIKEGYFKNVELFPSLIGVAVAAVTGFFAIRFMMKIIGKISLCWFSLYVAVIGIAVLLLQLAGSPRLPAFEIPSSAAEQKQAVQVQDQQADTESGQTESQPEDVVVLSTPQQTNQPEDIAPQDTAPQPIPIPEPEPQDFG